MLGTDIKRLRGERGWTQAELARELGTDPVTISRWERGVTRPRSGGIKRLAALLGHVPADQPVLQLIDEAIRTLTEIRELVAALPRASSEDKRRMEAMARGLNEAEIDTPFEGEALTDLIDWVNEMRARAGISPLEANQETRAPEEGIYERAKALGMVPARRPDRR